MSSKKNLTPTKRQRQKYALIYLGAIALQDDSDGAQYAVNEIRSLGERLLKMAKVDKNFDGFVASSGEIARMVHEEVST